MISYLYKVKFLIETVSYLYKCGTSNYRGLCLESKNLSSRLIKMHSHIKRCLKKFHNKSSISKRANLFDGKTF